MLHPKLVYKLSYYSNLILINLLINCLPINDALNIDSSSMDRSRSKLLIDNLQSLRSIQSEDHLRNAGNPDCNRVFSSDSSKTGTFQSPNYPKPYPANLHCIYNFTGRGKERIKIKFLDFNVYKPEDTDKDCNGADLLIVYITINGQRIRLDNLCGVELPKQLMSNDNSMMLEFKTFHQSTHTKGFSISYEFTTNFGILSGKQDPQKVCGFNYYSKDAMNGTFMSPNFPGYYPRDTECHYFFYGETNERVIISFTDFKIEGILPCTSDTASDYVEFSNYKTVDRKIPRACGTKIPNAIESDGDFFRITFKSNDRFDETGFKGNFQFKKPEDTNPIKQIRATTASPSSTFSACINSYLLIAILVYFKLRFANQFLGRNLI